MSVCSIQNPSDEKLARKLALNTAVGPAPAFKPELGPCCLWTKAKSRGGYGYVWTDGRARQVHVVTLELAGVEIPKGWTVDHLCRVRACRRLDHLEPVPGLVNWIRGYSPTAINARKTQCIRGHEFTEANTRRIITKSGRPGRNCRACARIYGQAYRARSAA